MTDKRFDLLLGKLLEDDISAPEVSELLDCLAQEPQRYNELVEHLVIWDIWDQHCQQTRSQSAFVTSLLARLGPYDEFTEKVRERILEQKTCLSLNIPDPQDQDASSEQKESAYPDLTPEEIENLAQRKLERFLAEQHSQASHAPAENGLALGDLTQGIAEKLIWLYRTCLRLAKWSVVCGVLVIISTLSYMWMHRPVAVLSDSYQARWAAPLTSHQLDAGPVTLEHGFAQLTFKNGARVILEGPAEVVLEKTDRMYLRKGKLTAMVEGKARGFTVRTDGATLVDLGTEFGVRAHDKGGGQAVVFDGKVQVTGNQPASRPVMVEDDHLVNVTARGQVGPVAVFAGDHDYFRTWKEVLYLPRAFGQCRVLRPTQAEEGKTFLQDNSDSILVVPESQGIPTAEGIQYVAWGPGDYNGQDLAQASDATLPVGTEVDSYLIHVQVNPQTVLKRTQYTCEITFPRPIVGAVVGASWLNLTDGIHGIEGLDYQDLMQNKRALEEQDLLTIREDGKTLSLTLEVKEYIDQFRVLIEAVDTP